MKNTNQAKTTLIKNQIKKIENDIDNAVKQYYIAKRSMEKWSKIEIKLVEKCNKLCEKLETL